MPWALWSWSQKWTAFLELKILEIETRLNEVFQTSPYIMNQDIRFIYSLCWCVFFCLYAWLCKSRPKTWLQNCALWAQGQHLQNSSKWICAHLDLVSDSGCKSLANSGVHKNTEVAERNLNAKVLLGEGVCSLGYAETSAYGDRDKNRDTERRGTANYKHHACSIMAKSTHTHTYTCKLSRPRYSHLSPLSFTQLSGKVHTIPKPGELPEKGSRGKIDVNRLNG